MNFESNEKKKWRLLTALIMRKALCLKYLKNSKFTFLKCKLFFNKIIFQ